MYPVGVWIHNERRANRNYPIVWVHCACACAPLCMWFAFCTGRRHIHFSVSRVRQSFCNKRINDKIKQTCATDCGFSCPDILRARTFYQNYIRKRRRRTQNKKQFRVSQLCLSSHSIPFLRPNHQISIFAFVFHVA